jgi:hypothetical protein
MGSLVDLLIQDFWQYLILLLRPLWVRTAPNIEESAYPSVV